MYFTIVKKAVPNIRSCVASPTEKVRNSRTKKYNILKQMLQNVISNTLPTRY